MLRKLKTKKIFNDYFAMQCNNCKHYRLDHYLAHALVHNIVHPLDKFKQADTSSTMFKSFIEQYLLFRMFV